MLRYDQRSFQIHGKLRQYDRFDMSGWPCRVSANTFSHSVRVSSSVLVSKPARDHVAGSHSTMKVLMAGA